MFGPFSTLHGSTSQLAESSSGHDTPESDYKGVFANNFDGKLVSMLSAPNVLVVQRDILWREASLELG